MKTSLILLAALAFSPSFAFPEAAAPAFVPERAPVIGMGWQQNVIPFPLSWATRPAAGRQMAHIRPDSERDQPAGAGFCDYTDGQIPGHMEERGAVDAEWTGIWNTPEIWNARAGTDRATHDIANTPL